MKIEDLEPFCHGYNEKMKQPWSRGEYTYASDGFVVVRVPRLAKAPELEHPVNAEKLYETNPEPDNYVAFPTLEQLGEVLECPECHGVAEDECPECDGMGHVELENDYHVYECECKTCNGEGEPECPKCKGAGFLEPTPRVVIDGATFNTCYIRPFLKFKNPRIAVCKETQKASWIKFDGGDGLVMPIIFANGLDPRA